MLRVALTGGIATGKTHVLARLRDRGVPTIDADDLVHEAFAPKTPTTQTVAREFGPAVLQPDGSVNRSALAAIVFADADARLRLEAIVHPVVYEGIKEWLRGVEGQIAIAAIPLLYETGREGDFDAVVVTSCSADQQLQRLMMRGLSEEDARHRLAAQIPPEEKARRAGYVIRTSGTLKETDRQVDDLLTILAERNSSSIVDRP